MWWFLPGITARLVRSDSSCDEWGKCCWLTMPQVPRPQPLHCGVHAPRRVAATTETGILSQTPAAAKWCKLSSPPPLPLRSLHTSTYLTSPLPLLFHIHTPRQHVVLLAATFYCASPPDPPTLHLPFPPLHALGSVNFRFAAT